MISNYFTVHCLNALHAKRFSIFRANIENTADKLALAKSIYPISEYHLEFHQEKKCLKVVL